MHQYSVCVSEEGIYMHACKLCKHLHCILMWVFMYMSEVLIVLCVLRENVRYVYCMERNYN